MLCLRHQGIFPASGPLLMLLPLAGTFFLYIFLMAPALTAFRCHHLRPAGPALPGSAPDRPPWHLLPSLPPYCFLLSTALAISQALISLFCLLSFTSHGQESPSALFTPVSPVPRTELTWQNSRCSGKSPSTNEATAIGDQAIEHPQQGRASREGFPEEGT